jgi:ribosomal protein S3
MGQKVHPLGFRVGITKKHQSQWFARFNKHKYAQSVLEDRMLRQTLTNLFPQLLNPVLKKQNTLRDKNEESSVVPKITQIKIERGLIPYEIGIQIHAENCDLIKKSIENLKVNRDLLCHLQKTRRYLQHLQLKLNDLSSSTSTSLAEQGENKTSENKVGKSLNTTLTSSIAPSGKVKSKVFNENKKEKRTGRFRTRLTKQQLRRQRLILKRLKKRQSIRRRYKQLVYKGLFLTKKGNKVIQKFTQSKAFAIDKSSSQKLKTAAILSSKKEEGKLGQNQVMSASTINNKKKTANVFKSRVKKKFVSIFINRMNNKFLQVLKNTFIASVQNNNTSKEKSLSWNKKWNFANVQKQLAVKPLSQLTKLSTVLERKSLKKMESLRKNYIASGLISKTDALNYYQMLNFLKQLKELISQIKRKQKFQFILNKYNSENNTGSLSSYPKGVSNNLSVSLQLNSQKLQRKTNVNSVTLNVLSNKLNNIDNECRKVQFIEYLKQTVKKHRTDNIYLYLSTIADARKDLRKLQQFTKRNAAFLFGSSLTNITNNTNNANVSQLAFERVSNVCKQTTSFSALSTVSQNEQVNTNVLDKSLSEIFLEQIEKQRNMYKDNAQLTPKIAIKFYSVNPSTLKAKASVIADSVVDALEKRKAFRKVIKDAKEDLMRTPGVKGVKIQLSGRLNGAEIARSEWVRAGRVPLQTLRANLDYSYKTANTIYGIIGIKVWIFKGYTKLI